MVGHTLRRCPSNLTYLKLHYVKRDSITYDDGVIEVIVLIMIR